MMHGTEHTAQIKVWWTRPSTLSHSMLLPSLHPSHPRALAVLTVSNFSRQLAVLHFQVSLPNPISDISTLTSPTSIQKVLSETIEDQLFPTMLESSSPAYRAHLLSVAAPHHSSCMVVSGPIPWFGHAPGVQ